MTFLEHKGYTATVEFDAGDGILVGRVIGVNDVITFHGTTVKEVVAAFRESVDDYLGLREARPESGQTGERQVHRSCRAAHASVGPRDGDGRRKEPEHLGRRGHRARG